ncbi:v2 [Exomis microphylla associated virus]|uniref:V2 n=1 Tax=Exomis microphylla associated virus TaxID=2093275 RepID=A0A2I8B2K7_9GEMI|nr:v2 [Exomis microphylla associated virus]AUT11875.1 v2 [Exomis microphylla associated virus]
MVPFRVRDFPRNYPAFLAAATSCLLRYNKWFILGTLPEVTGTLTVEEQENFIQFQKQVRKILRSNWSFVRKCRVYEIVYTKYGGPEPEEKVPEWDPVDAEEEDEVWEVPVEEVSGEKACESKQGC